MSEIEYLPYKMINVYIEREYLEQILGDVLDNLKNLPKDDQIYFASQFRKYVKVLGFRNPVRAPKSLQLKAYSTAFEDKEEVIPFTLSTWAKLNQDFADQVKGWLQDEGWENLTHDRTYEETGGFQQKWPEDFTFDQIEERFTKAYPDQEISRNDLILMVLWITGSLPKEQSV